MKLRLKSKASGTKLQLKSRGNGKKTSEHELEVRYSISLAAKEEGKQLVIACLGHGYYSGKHSGEHTWSHFPDYAERFQSLKEANTMLAGGLPSYAGVVIDSRLPYLA